MPMVSNKLVIFKVLTYHLSMVIPNSIHLVQTSLLSFTAAFPLASSISVFDDPAIYTNSTCLKANSTSFFKISP